MLRQPGARPWSIHGLGVLRDPDTVSVLIKALFDPAVEVRREGRAALRMLCRKPPRLRDTAVQALASCSSDPEIGAKARKAAQDIMAFG